MTRKKIAHKEALDPTNAWLVPVEEASSCLWDNIWWVVDFRWRYFSTRVCAGTMTCTWRSSPCSFPSWTLHICGWMKLSFFKNMHAYSGNEVSWEKYSYSCFFACHKDWRMRLLCSVPLFFSSSFKGWSFSLSVEGRAGITSFLRWSFQHKYPKGNLPLFFKWKFYYNLCYLL